MSTTKISNTEEINSEEYYRQIRQIYHQLKSIEKTMKDYSLNDSMYFVQLTQQCFEKEIAKGS